MKSFWIVWPFGILFVAFVTGYGFRNCIQDIDDPESYTCVHRVLLDIRSAVSDLPNNTKSLNVSNNRVRSLPPRSFIHMTKLEMLRLDSNNLSNIVPGAFDQLTSLNTLNLSSNNLSRLFRETFRGLHNLTQLRLDRNALVSIHLEAFEPLVRLELLNLSCNRLKSFDEFLGSLQPLPGLRSLFVCKNRFRTLNHSRGLPPSLSQLFLCANQLQELNCRRDLFANVSHLDLSYNNLTASSLLPLSFGKIGYLTVAFNKYFDIFQFIKNTAVPLNRIDYSGLHLNDCSKLSRLCRYLRGVSLNTLTLAANTIKVVDPMTPMSCNVTGVLDLSRNRLKDLQCLEFMNQTELVRLTVEHNLLKQLKNCKNQKTFPKLAYISFRYNRIWSVYAHAFSYAPNVEELQLNINNLIFLENNAFDGLRRLKTLRLDNNLITDLYKSTFLGLTELRILNLRNNRLSVIFQNVFQSLGNLQILDLGGNKITGLKNNSFRGLQNLTKLYLDRNNIKTISSYTFRDVETTLRVLDLVSNQLSFESSKEQASPFYRLQKLYDLKLQNQQPYGLTVLPRGFFKGLTSLKSLYLAQNKISFLNADVFDELSQLTFLTLADDCNGIRNLPDGIFKNLTNLRVLSLENIGLQALTFDVFSNLTKLRKLQLTKNALKHINVKVLKTMTSLRYVDLRKCPLTCTCNNQELQRWLYQPQVQVVYPYNLTCPGKPTSYFHEFDAQVCDMKIKVQLFSCSFPCLLLFIIIPIVYSKSYWRIKYNYFLFIAWLHERWKSDKEIYKYDAFVSYNTNDEHWVFNKMLPALENCDASSAFRLCLHHRDFQLGRDIIDNIVDSIHNSRKTICVVSRNYLRSEWCSLEMQLASYKLFDEMRDVLVLIFLDNIPDRELSTYHRMRKVMLKKTYISWPSEPEAEKLFWAKLIKALKGIDSPEVTVDDGTFMDEKSA